MHREWYEKELRGEVLLNITFIDAKLNLNTGGGSNQSLHIIASKLARLGHEIKIITLIPALNAYPKDLPYTVLSEGPLSNRLERKYGLTLSSILRKHQNDVDIYHIWSPSFVLDGAVYRKCGGKTPVIAYLNSYSFCSRPEIINTECSKHCSLISRISHRPESLMRKVLLSPLRIFEYLLETIVLNSVDAFVATSPVVAEIYSSQNINERKISVIAPAIDYEYLQSLKYERKPPKLSDNRYNILYVGRLSAEKGVDVLLNAVSKLDFPLRIHIVGDGPYRDTLEKYSKKLGISNKLIFHGWIPFDKVVDFYLGSQLFVHPARWPEPFGRTILDAMALGLPVIAADSGGPPWALQGTGLTFRPGDAPDLAEKINHIRSNPSLAKSLAARAQERAKEFDFTKAIPQLLRIYQSAIDVAKLNLQY